MTSIIKVDNLNKVSDDSTIIKKCGSTTTVGSGSGQTIVVDGATITLGRCGGTVSLASGATQSGFGRSGSVNWCTTIKTSPLTTESGKGYFINTAGGAVTVTLPSGPSVGDIVAVADAGRSAGCNAITIGRNSQKIDNLALCGTICTSGGAATLVYTGSCNGWKTVADTSANLTAPLYITATGGNAITTCGNFKTHIFTGPGSFAVSCVSSCAALNVAEYLIVAGGGSAGTRIGGGGGAGGARVFETSPLKSPIVAPAGVTLSVQSYPITVGGGGTGQPYPGSAVSCSSGTNSVALGLTAAGGGRGASYNTIASGSGGSGGGGSGYDTKVTAGNGNTPSVSPSQGNPGGAAFGNSCGPGGAFNLAGGGGGAEAAGTGAAAPSQAGPASNTRFFAGGGAGGPNGAAPDGGGGGKGYAPDAPAPTGRTAIANTGGGGGSTPGTPGPDGISGAGGSGIVMIRYRYQ